LLREIENRNTCNGLRIFMHQSPCRANFSHSRLWEQRSAGKYSR
jgi:hypothetical protein